MRNSSLGRISQMRQTAIKYTLSLSLLFLAVAIIEVSLLSRWRILDAVPDVMLVTVVIVSFFLGRFTGAIAGIGAGVLIEALGGNGISLLPVVYLLCGYLTGHYARAMVPRRFVAYLLYLGIALLARGVTTLTYAGMTYESFHLPSILLQLLLPEVLVTAIWGILLYLPVRRICRAVGGIEK